MFVIAALLSLVGASFAEIRPGEDFVRAAAQNRADEVAAALKNDDSGIFKDYQEEETGLSAWHYTALFCSVEMALSLREAGANPNLISKEFHVVQSEGDTARTLSALNPFQVLMMSIAESKKANTDRNFADCQQVAQIMTGHENLGCLDQKCVDFTNNTVLLGNEKFAFGNGETAAALAPLATEDSVLSNIKGEIKVSGDYSDGINNIANGILNGKLSARVGQKLTLETNGELIYREVDQDVTRRRLDFNFYEKYPVDRLLDEHHIDAIVYSRQGYTTDKLGGFDRRIDVVLGVGLDYDQQDLFFGNISSALGGDHVVLDGGESSLNGQFELEGLLGLRLVKNIKWVNKALLKDSTFLRGNFPSRTVAINTFVETPLAGLFKVNTGYTYRLIDVNGDVSVINIWGVGVALVF